jgi:molybdopterin converting factor small subunit
MGHEDRLRAHLLDLLGGGHAHPNFDQVAAGRRTGLEREYPGLGFNLCYETGELRPYVNIFVDREDSRYLQGLDTPVRDGATIHILQSVAGG